MRRRRHRFPQTGGTHAGAAATKPAAPGKRLASAADLKPSSCRCAGGKMKIFALTLLATTGLALPDGKAGIGFDDLRYDAALGRLLVPAGRTGNLDLIDPATQEIT